MGVPDDTTKSAITTPTSRKRDRLLAVGSSSSASAFLGNGVLNGAPEDATSDKFSVLKEPPPPPPSTELIEPQGEPPTLDATSKWNFNLEEPDATLTLPPVPAGWSILKLLPSEEVATNTPEAMFRGLERCIKRHRYTMWLAERDRAFDPSCSDD